MKRSISKRKNRRGATLGLAAFWSCAAAFSNFAQEALRNSLAGDATAAAQRLQQQQNSQSYTYKAGDFQLLVVPSLELDYNDNVTLSKQAAKQDIIVKPLLQLSGSEQLTQQNLLSFSAGVGYDEYLEHGQYSALRINSDSALSLDMYVKDFAFNFHDRVSYTQDPSAQAALANTPQYRPFVNDAGLTTTWDLEDVVLTLGFDRQDMIVSPSQFAYLDQASELPLARAGLRLDPTLTVGLEASASFTSYQQHVLNDNQSYSAGVFGSWQPGSYFSIQPRAGYTTYQFDHTSDSGQVYGVTQPAPSIQTRDLNSWYADLAVSHEINDKVKYAFNAGHEIRLGIESDAIEDWYFRPNVTWSIFKDVDFNTLFFFEHGSEGSGNIAGNLAETYDWYGGALALSYAVMRKLRLTLNYRLTLRASNIDTRSYTQNIVGLTVSYQTP